MKNSTTTDINTDLTTPSASYTDTATPQQIQASLDLSPTDEKFVSSQRARARQTLK